LEIQKRVKEKEKKRKKKKGQKGKKGRKLINVFKELQKLFTLVLIVPCKMAIVCISDFRTKLVRMTHQQIFKIFITKLIN